MVGVVLNAVGPQHAYGAYYSSTYGYGYGYGHNVESKIGTILIRYHAGAELVPRDLRQAGAQEVATQFT